ncbi:hypothetical protein BDV06DRAFT_181536 [Aspergillus oleicola]
MRKLADSPLRPRNNQFPSASFVTSGERALVSIWRTSNFPGSTTRILVKIPLASPFYHSTSTSNLQTSLNNTTTQSQDYPSYQQQDEPYIRLEDVLPYTSYRWGPPPTREYSRQTAYPDNTSGLPSSASIPNQSPERPAASNRQLPAPMPQYSTETSLANDVHSGHDAKRRRLDPPVASQTSQVSQQPLSVPRVASGTSAFLNSRPQATTQPPVQRTSQQAPRIGSQYVSPAQVRPIAQAMQRTASPATSQGSTARASQYASQAQSKPAARAPSSASPQTTAQQIARRNSQYASPKGSAQSLPHTVAPPAAQVTAQRNPQNIPRPNSQYNSPISTAESLPQTVATSDTQTKPPQISHHFSRPYPSPQSRTQSLPQENQQPAANHSQPAQPTPKAGSKPTPQPAFRPISQSTSKSSPSIRAAGQPIQSATLPVQNNAPQSLAPQRPPSTHTVPPGPAPARPPQPSSQTAPAPSSQPGHGPQGNFTVYAYQPANPTDRTHLKRRHDIVSRLNEADAALKLTYDPKTIARDVLIAASRHPTESTLNHHLFRLRDLFTAVDMTSDLATFRWDLVDPGQPSRDLQVKARAPQAAPMQTSQTAPPPAVQVPVNNLSAPQPPVHQQHRPPQPVQQVQLPPPPPQQPKLQTQPQIQVQAQSQPAPSPLSRPPTGAQTPSTPNTMEKKRRGRPPGSTNKPKVAVAALVAAPVVESAPTASFPVFPCKWGNCQAELHNLDGLKKHIFKIHVSKQITCGWRGCAFTGTLPAADLMKHVKTEHLDSLAWKLGDGPTVPTNVDRNSSSNTVPLTIPGSNQPGNEDSLIFPADYRSIRAFNKVHGNDSQQEKAQEIFKAVQRLKQHIGVGLDPGGCELATPLRNQRVSDEEDVYEVKPIY